MTADFRQFIIKILIFSTIIFAISTILFTTIFKTWYFPAYPYLLLLIAAITTTGHLLVLKASAKNTRKFTTAFMASVTLKLMVYLTFILVYLMINRSQAIPFVLTFLAFYISFTVFEVVQALNAIKKQSKISL